MQPASRSSSGRRAPRWRDAPSTRRLCPTRTPSHSGAGPVLADLVFESHACLGAERLAELRLAACAEWADCELARGRPDRVIAELERLAVEHPLHERFRGQLMVALYRSGRQSEALAAYHEARRALLEMGLTPGPELRELEKAILSQDSALAPASRARAIRRPPQQARRSRRRLLAVAAALVAAGVAASLPSWRLNAHRPVALAAIASDSIGVVDPVRNALVDQIALHARPAAVAYGAGSLWVATHDEQTLLQIDPRTHEVIRTRGLGAEPTAIAIGDGFVWVLCGPDRLLFQFDADTGVLVRSSP